ncbi:MAG: ThuA domain-containing protein [Pseudomonadota bacterium]
MTREIALIAGDYWHAPGPWQSMLAGLLKGSSANLSIYVDANPLDRIFDEANLDLIVLVREGQRPGGTANDFWLSVAEEDQLQRYVRDGGRLVALHCGVCTYRPDGPMRSMMKGHFVSHPEESSHVVGAVAAAGCALDLGFLPFPVFDEFYLVDTDPNETTVFAEILSPEHGRQIAGWTHPFGNGHFTAFTPGHNRPVLKYPSYQRIVREIILGQMAG